ncbi:hypothetical protein [Candidatus Palauibacter sp.]|uniref:hypothetical protein n=1 Tax=Candidatus Palauibacter sp. TaxID=3101350 RepID=UPI003AF27EAD
MFDQAIVDVALGLALLYVVLSLAASAITEWISALLGLRSKNLRAGVERLLGEDYAGKVYGHPLVGKLSRIGKMPSYIEPDTLSTALLDVLAHDEDGNPVLDLEGSATELVDRVDDGHALKPALRALTLRGAKTVDDLRREVAEWFDEGMTRVSGWYKRRAQLLILAIGAVVTVSANASTLHIARDLWTDETLRASLADLGEQAAEAAAVAGAEVPDLGAFPLGWEAEDVRAWSFLDWVARLFGWLITISAVSLGAPFWFDLLGKVANLRAAGGTRARTP